MFGNLIKHILGRQLGKAAVAVGATPPAENHRWTDVPLGLHQGSAVKISGVLQPANEARGGALPEFDDSRTIRACGRMSHSGMRLFRSHLSEGKGFIETVPDLSSPKLASQVRLFLEAGEIQPMDAAGWEFFLGEADGLVGGPTFQIDGAEGKPAHLFHRVWGGGGPERVRPVEAQEDVMDTEGGVQNVRHRMMLYGRELDGRPEYLLADVVTTDGGASVRIYVGQDLAPSEITVFADGGEA